MTNGESGTQSYYTKAGLRSKLAPKKKIDRGRYVLIKCRTTRVQDLIDIVTDGSIRVSFHSNEADALEEIAYDPDYDWIILSGGAGSSYNTGYAKVVRRKDPVKQSKVRKQIY